MKMKVITLCFGIILTAIFVACGDDPAPRFRVTNNYASSVNISYKVADGNTVNMNGVEPGTTSEWKTVPETTVTVAGFPANSAKTQDPISFATKNGSQYTVVIAVDGRASILTGDQ